MNYRKLSIVIASTLVIILCVSGIVYFDYPYLIKQGSAELTITSASATTSSNNGPNTLPVYSLNINLHIKFNGQMHFDHYTALSVCSFNLHLNSSVFGSMPWTCSLPPYASEIFSGSANFTLIFNLIPINSSITVQYLQLPLFINFFVNSDDFNVTSQNYALQIDQK